MLKSKILACLSHKTKCGITGFTDGANVYKAAAKTQQKSKGLRFFQVKHTQSQFTVAIRKRTGVKKAGTQQCDRIWHHVKKALPKSLTSRAVDGHVNDQLFWSYVHLIALAAETKVAAKEFLNSLISPQNSRNFPAFTCFPCLICCKTGACRDVAVSFHIMLGYGTETRMQYVFDIGLRHTHLFNMCGKDTMF